MPEENNDNYSNDDISQGRLFQLKEAMVLLRRNIDKISQIIEKIEHEQKKEMYKKMPGVEGTFDGLYLIAESGEKHEVPANYAAKSRLVYGDRLKIVEEDGKKVFKQITKEERLEIKGVLSKKEGKWYLLSDSGTYRISDTSAEFNQASLNEEAVGFIPLNNKNAPYAALDRIIRKEETKKDIKMKEHGKKEVSNNEKINSDNSKKSKERNKDNIQNIRKKDEGRVHIPQNKFKPAPKKEDKRVEKASEVKNDKKEYVANILTDDDLR